MQKVNDKYMVRLNALSRNLLLSSLSTCKFTLLHYDHPFAAVISDNKLIDPDHLIAIFNKIKNAENTDMLEFSIEDEILIYTALDITCKFFLTELSDDLKIINKGLIESTSADYAEVRSTLLKGAQFVRDGMRETLKDNEEFSDRVELLELVLTVS